MKNLFITFLIILLFSSCRISFNLSKNDDAINLEDYELVFHDDFNGTQIDNNNWMYCAEVERQDYHGKWQNSCSTVENGNYVINCTLDENGKPISGGIKSAGRFDQTYGLYHIRFKMPKTNAMWFAFWLMSYGMGEEPGTVGNGAKDGAELDIFEIVPGADEFSMSVHWDDYDKDLKSSSEWFYISEEFGEEFYDEYHDVWYLWDENGYQLFIDGLSENNRKFNFSGEEHGEGTCQVPCYMILSVEYGAWGGALDETQFPFKIYVDSVSVYAKNQK